MIKVAIVKDDKIIKNSKIVVNEKKGFIGTLVKISEKYQIPAPVWTSNEEKLLVKNREVYLKSGDLQIKVWYNN